MYERSPSSEASSAADPRDTLMDSWRRRGDPSADAVIAELAASGEIRAVSGLLRQLVVNEQPVPDELPAGAGRWLQSTASLPQWADLERVERGLRLVSITLRRSR